MVLAAAGGVDHTHLTQLADRYFGGLSASHEGEVPPLCKYVAWRVAEGPQLVLMFHNGVVVVRKNLSVVVDTYQSMQNVDVNEN